MRREGSPALSPGGMLDEPIFPAFGTDASAASPESPTELQKNDPLGTQIWKLYSRAKTQLPNAERMSNLTWRMMALNMRRAEEQRNKGYERRHTIQPFAVLQLRAFPSDLADPDCCMHRSIHSPQSNELSSPPPASARPLPRTAPSGIAQQLRRSADQQAQVQQPQPQPQPQPAQDTMNLDDFIFPSSVGSPAGLSPEPSNGAEGPFNASPGVPIRKPNQLNDHNLSLAHASAPPVPPQINRESEFGYVPRHVRKTSIDERRVSCLSLRPSCPSAVLLTSLSATQATSRSLTAGPSCQQHHDSHRRPGRGRLESLFARPFYAASRLPRLAGAGTLLNRHIPDARGSCYKFSRTVPAELWLLPRRLTYDEPRHLLPQHLQPQLDGLLPQLDRLLLAPKFRLPIRRLDATAHERR